MSRLPGNIFDLPELRERTRVFKDRSQAGEVLAGMLGDFRDTDALVLGIPAGGVPVGTATAAQIGLPFDVAVVSKITLPWNTEAGYGAVAFDGTRRLNEKMLLRVHLTDEEIRKGIARTTAKVKRRVRTLRGEQSFPDVASRPVILVDDGLASGFTMRVAVEALRNAGAGRVIVVVPTGHRSSVEMIGKTVEAIYCPNIRSGPQYAVASAYEHWSDVTEEEVIRILSGLKTE